MAYLVDYVFVFVLSYIIGSIPFSWIITKLKTGKDLRRLGSRNVGGRNVYRITKSLNWALFAGFLDVSRSFAAIFVPYMLIRYPIGFVGLEDGRFLLTVAGIAAVVGHNWPLYLQSHGGRGITVIVGTMSFINPALIAVWLILWPIVILFVGYSSIAYIAVTILVGIFALFLPSSWIMPWIDMDRLEIALILFGIALLMITRQADNIRQIKAGEAKKISLIKAIRKKSKLSDEMLK
ncbi:MAG: glycerol-3-phosphate acyltransferase [Candidatus Heimdallarchaeaceae archaeon]